MLSRFGEPVQNIPFQRFHWHCHTRLRTILKQESLRVTSVQHSIETFRLCWSAVSVNVQSLEIRELPPLENAAANRGQSYRLDRRIAKRLSHQGASVGQWPTRCASLVIEKKGVRRRYDVALRPKLFAAVPRDKLQEQVAGLHDWVAISGFRPLIHERTQAAADRFPQTAVVRSVLEFGRTMRRHRLLHLLLSFAHASL
jgi:hypothetical protein